MQASGLTSTMPFSYCTIAPGAGQAARQPGSSQCMHWSLRISQRQHAVALLLVEADQVPEARVERRASSGRCRSAWSCTGPQVVPFLAGHLAGLAADAGRRVDELRDDGQAAHARRASPRREADERRISSSWMAMAPPLGLLELHEEGLVLRRPGVGVHRGRREQCWRAGRCGLRDRLRKPQWIGNPICQTLLAVDLAAGRSRFVTMATPWI